MSSRKLLVLLHHSPDESPFRTDAERGGRQTRAQRVAEERFNEALRLRSVYEAVSSRGEVRWDPSDYFWLDPIDQRERDQARAAEQAEAELAQEDFYADLGLT